MGSLLLLPLLETLRKPITITITSQAITITFSSLLHHYINSVTWKFTNDFAGKLWAFPWFTWCHVNKVLLLEGNEIFSKTMDLQIGSKQPFVFYLPYDLEFHRHSCWRHSAYVICSRDQWTEPTNCSLHGIYMARFLPLSSVCWVICCGFWVNISFSKLTSKVTPLR